MTEPVMDASVSVGYDQPGRAVPPDFIGLSYESSVLASKDYLSPENASLLGLLQGLGPGGVLRLGGNMSESTVWRDTAEGNGGERFLITPEAIDQLAALLDAIDWRLIYGLNLARGTPAAAADEASYVASALGSRLIAFQIGNEPDGFGAWRHVRPPTYDCDAFLSEWTQFHRAIRARLPDAPFAGPGIAVQQGWIRPFINAAGESLVLVTRHHYADGPAGSPHLSIEKLLSAAPRVAAMLEEVLATKHSTGLPFRIVETNSIFNEGECGLSDTFASALWGLEYMLQLADAGAQGFNFHAGDAKAYTPFVPGAKDRPAARPLYYGTLMFKEVVRDAVMVPVRLVAPDRSLAAYAARSIDGGLKVCLINKDLKRNAEVRIDTGQEFERAALLHLAAPSVEATSGVEIGGSTVDDFGRRSRLQLQPYPWQNNRYVTLARTSATMIQFDGAA